MKKEGISGFLKIKKCILDFYSFTFTSSSSSPPPPPHTHTHSRHTISVPCMHHPLFHRTPYLISCSWSRRHEQSKQNNRPRDVLDWINEAVPVCEIGNTADTAQVHPFKLTTSLADQACRQGARLVIGTVEGIELEKVQSGATGGREPEGGRAKKQGKANFGPTSAVKGVRVAGEVILCDRVVIAMGPWSHMACAWLPLGCEIIGRKAHSIVM